MEEEGIGAGGRLRKDGGRRDAGGVRREEEGEEGGGGGKWVKMIRKREEEDGGGRMDEEGCGGGVSSATNEGNRSHGHRLQIIAGVLHCWQDFVRGQLPSSEARAVTSRRPQFQTVLAHL